MVHRKLGGYRKKCGILNPITQRTQINIDEKQDAPFFRRKKKRFISVKTNLILVINMGIRVKARYGDKVLKPLEELGLEEGEEVEIEVKKNPVEMLEGMIKISNKKWVDEIIESPDLEPV